VAARVLHNRRRRSVSFRCRKRTGRAIVPRTRPTAPRPRRSGSAARCRTCAVRRRSRRSCRSGTRKEQEKGQSKNYPVVSVPHRSIPPRCCDSSLLPIAPGNILLQLLKRHFRSPYVPLGRLEDSKAAGYGAGIPDEHCRETIQGPGCASRAHPNGASRLRCRPTARTRRPDRKRRLRESRGRAKVHVSFRAADWACRP
jgi:hypothetical protein